MAEIVNLRQTRKRLAREAAEREAAENRTRFGLTKGQKAKAGSERARILAALDGSRIVKGGSKDDATGG